MIKDQAFGVILVHKVKDKEPLFLLIKQIGNYWSFPKGHKEGKETSLETAKRELLEETGITQVEWQENPTFTTNSIFDRDGEKYDKTNLYFLAFAPETFKSKPKEEFTHEILASTWVSYSQAREMLNYPPFIEALDEANKYLNLDS